MDQVSFQGSTVPGKLTEAPRNLSRCISNLLDMELGGWDSSPDPAAINSCVFVLITVSLALGCLIYKIVQLDSMFLRPFMVLM